MDINLLKYGNAAQSIQFWMTQPNPYQNLNSELSLIFPYSNDSFEMLRELTFLSKLMTADDIDQKLPLFQRIDEDLEGFLRGVLQSLGIPWSNEVFTYVKSQISPLTAILKAKYNRPRPFQVAYYREIDLFPFSSITAWSASYPSGHTLLAGYFLQIIGYVYEGIAPKLQKAVSMVAKSREALGVHYPSDNNFSLDILKKVMKHKHTEVVIDKVAEMHTAKSGIKNNT